MITSRVTSTTVHTSNQIPQSQLTQMIEKYHRSNWSTADDDFVCKPVRVVTSFKTQRKMRLKYWNYVGNMGKFPSKDGIVLAGGDVSSFSFDPRVNGNCVIDKVTTWLALMISPNPVFSKRFFITFFWIHFWFLSFFLFLFFYPFSPSHSLLSERDDIQFNSYYYLATDVTYFPSIYVRFCFYSCSLFFCPWSLGIIELLDWFGIAWWIDLYSRSILGFFFFNQFHFQGFELTSFSVRNWMMRRWTNDFPSNVVIYSWYIGWISKQQNESNMN